MARSHLLKYTPQHGYAFICLKNEMSRVLNSFCPILLCVYLLYLMSVRYVPNKG